jgi:hypothetical protein
VRAFLIWLAMAAAVALASPAFWWLVGDKTSVTVGEAVEADGARRTVMTGPKAPWPDWAWTPADARLNVRYMAGPAPGHTAGGYGELQYDGPAPDMLERVRTGLVAQGWTFREYRFDGQAPTLPPQQLVLCTLRAERTDPARTLTYVFTLAPEKMARVHWDDGPAPGPWQTGVERRC